MRIAALMLAIAAGTVPASGWSDTPDGGSAISLTARDGAAAGIDWFDGSIDEAFATAAREDKPVFLYWGAVWCPPCHAIKNTVFKSRDFIERSRLFIPVYLDGDTPHAQAAGERFGVLGYPTMIVFDAAGEELTRIPGGIDVQAYAHVLDLTLANAVPVAETLDELVAGTGSLSPEECTRLAYYSWGQNPALLSDRDPVSVYRRMVDACAGAPPEAASILYFNWLGARLDADDGEDAAAPLDTPERQEGRRTLNRVLGDRALIRANLLALEFDGPRFVTALSDAGSPERAQLVRRLSQAYGDIYADDAVYKRERIYAYQGLVGLEQLDDPEAPMPVSLTADLRAMAAWADSSTPDVYERQPVINAVANVLQAAGMDDLARTVLLKEVGVSEQPYYFMPDLAAIEQRAGNYDKALDWLHRGWETSAGPATRFQWGSYYLSGLLEMAPDDVDTIEALAVTLVDEVVRSAGLYQRPKAQLQRLGKKLAAWSESHDAGPALASIRTAVADVCARDADSGSREACQAFLDAA